MLWTFFLYVLLLFFDIFKQWYSSFVFWSHRFRVQKRVNVELCFLSLRTQFSPSPTLHTLFLAWFISVVFPLSLWTLVSIIRCVRIGVNILEFWLSFWWIGVAFALELIDGSQNRLLLFCWRTNAEIIFVFNVSDRSDWASKLFVAVGNWVWELFLIVKGVVLLSLVHLF